MDGTCKRDSSPGCRIHRRQGGTGGRMVSECNEQYFQYHGKEDQGLHQM